MVNVSTLYVLQLQQIESGTYCTVEIFLVILLASPVSVKNLIAKRTESKRPIENDTSFNKQVLDSVKMATTQAVRGLQYPRRSIARFGF